MDVILSCVVNHVQINKRVTELNLCIVMLSASTGLEFKYSLMLLGKKMYIIGLL